MSKRDLMPYVALNLISSNGEKSHKFLELSHIFPPSYLIR